MFMFKHYVIFLEDMKSIQKTAFHMIICDEKDFETIRKYKEKLQKLDIDFYTHLVTTKSAKIKSLSEKDYFFKDTHFIENFDTFVKFAQTKN